MFSPSIISVTTVIYAQAMLLIHLKYSLRLLNIFITI